MQRTLIQDADVGRLDDRAAVHNRDGVDHLSYDAEVVSDEQDRRLSFIPEQPEPLDDLCLQRDVKVGRRLVGYEYLRSQGGPIASMTSCAMPPLNWNE